MGYPTPEIYIYIYNTKVYLNTMNTKYTYLHIVFINTTKYLRKILLPQQKTLEQKNSTNTPFNTQYYSNKKLRTKTPIVHSPPPHPYHMKSHNIKTKTNNYTISKKNTKTNPHPQYKQPPELSKHKNSHPTKI